MRATLGAAFGLILALDSLLGGEGEQGYIVESVSSARLWEGAIGVAAEPRWVFGSQGMLISPSQVDGEMYVPYDLSDAWREMDHMLAKDYVSYMAAHASETCFRAETNENAKLAHTLLGGFLVEKWLNRSSSRYWNYFVTSFDFSLADFTKPAQVEFLGDMRAIAVNWTLCSFYEWKQRHAYPDFAKLIAEFRQGVDSARRRLRDVQ